MIEDFGDKLGIRSLTYTSVPLEITLDDRRESLIFRYGLAGANGSRRGAQLSCTIRLNKFSDFEEDFRAAAGLRNESNHSAPGRPKNLIEALRGLAGSREAPSERGWHNVMGRFAFLLLRYARKQRRRRGHFQQVAQELLSWLGPTEPKTAWRAAYDEKLSFEHRYRLLRDAQHTLSGGPNHAGSLSQPELPVARDRELFWWAALCRFDLALDWYRSEGHDHASRRALEESSVAYLQILKDEPRRRELARFLQECGSDVEEEVKRVLFPGKNERAPKIGRFRSWGKSLRGLPRKIVDRLQGRAARPLASGKRRPRLVNDEVIRRTFFIWFLKRYDWMSAARLLFSTPSHDEKLGLATALFLMCNGAALLTAFVQISFVFKESYPNFPESMLGLMSAWRTPMWWGLQVSLQLISLVLVLLIAPSLFRLLMPRALFGSLLAWTTIMILALPDLRDMTIAGQEHALISMCHDPSISKVILYSTSIGLATLVLSSIFIAYTVTQFISKRRTLAKRTLSTTFGLLLGSLFWSMIFALPAKVVLESGSPHDISHSSQEAFIFNCYSFLPIVIVGTTLAVLFGLVVQLIWDDVSLTEPLGEPL